MKKYLKPSNALIVELVRRYWILGMELLSTVDLLLHKEQVAHDEDSLLQGVQNWPAGKHWAQRKLNIFDRPSLALALNRLETVGLGAAS